MRINIPEKLTELLAINLLEQELPSEIEYREILNLDFKGKEYSRSAKYKEGFIYKTVAAIGYEKFEDLKSAVYAYERAGKNSSNYLLPLAANICLGRALEIYSYILTKDDERENINELENGMLFYLINKITENAGVYRGVYHNEKPESIKEEIKYNWFTKD